MVSKSALKELLFEALENEGAMGHDADPPIVPNVVIDRTTLQLDTDPVELRHVPRTKNELIIMVRNLLDDVSDDQSGELYKKIKNVFAGDDVGTRDFAKGEVVKDKVTVTPDINQARELQRDPNKMESKKKSNISNVIRSIVEDVMRETSKRAKRINEDPSSKQMRSGGQMFDPDDVEMQDPEDDVHFIKDDGLEDGPFGDDELSDSAWDPDTGDEEEDDDDDSDDKKKRKSRAGLEIGAYGVDGMTLEKIGAELGFTKEAAKKAVETAMERFKALHVMDPEDSAELVLTGVDDYIDMLSDTGEMSEDEESFMRLHPRVVAMSDNFRDFFSKYVKRAARELRADTQDDTDL